MTWWHTTTWYWRWPEGALGWALWAGWGIALLVGMFLARRRYTCAWRWQPRHTALLAILLVFTPVFATFVGYPSPQMPEDWTAWEGLSPAVWLPLGALTWGLAAGWLGIVPAMLLAAVEGTLRGLLWTHSPFAPWEAMTAALVISWAAFQPYRTLLFRLLRRPWGGVTLAGLASLLFPWIEWVAQRSSGGHWWPALTEYSHRVVFWWAELTVVMVVGTLVTGLRLWPWGRREEEATEPSPLERSLAGRFLGLSLPLALLIGGAMAVISIAQAQRAAQRMLADRLQVVTGLAAESIPFFLESGQDHIHRLTTQAEALTDPATQAKVLQQAFASSAFFTRLLLADAQGHVVAAYPPKGERGLSPDEMAALPFALAGVPNQVVTSPPLGNASVGWVSFVAPLPDETHVLIGRTSLETNPVMAPLVEALRTLQTYGGVGLVLDEEGRVLYPADMLQPPIPFRADEWVASEGEMVAITSPTGERRWMIARRTLGRPWWVVALLPSDEVLRLTLQIALPLIAVALGLYALSLVGMQSLLRMITRSLGALADEAQRIARGDLDHPLQVEGVDEVGQLRQAFEQMRQSLKERLTELRQLLEVSRHTARAVEVEQLVRPVLEAALKVRPEAVRIALVPTALPSEGESRPRSFGAGPHQGEYAYLDMVAVRLAHQKNQIVLRHPERLSDIQVPPGSRAPGVLVCLALRYEQHLFGALYVVFSDEETVEPASLDYLRTLAGQLSLALANARLLLETQLDKQRLEAVLASSPDPILVTDERGRLILANPAAFEVLQVDFHQIGKPLRQALPIPDLVDLLLKPGRGPHSAEITLEDGRVFFASVSDVRSEGRPVGRVAVLRDITHYKELDALKSEFVATVSHDLRSPLTLVRGYATMLDLTARLDERQKQYLRQILQAVDSMSRLVNNLLDLGRIEAGVGLQLRMVPVEDVVRQVAKTLEAKAQAKRIRLTVEIAPNAPPLVEADPSLLERALANLVDNAIKYTPPEGRVTVRVAPLGQDQVLLTVEDTGVGIAPVDQPRLFEKFFRVKRRDVQREQGSGLGLAIVKSIVERHHGRVWVESQLGKGSQFHIALPLRQPQKES